LDKIHKIDFLFSPVKGDKTSGRQDTKLGIGIVRPPPVDIGALGIKIAKVDQIAVRGTRGDLYLSIQGNSNSHQLGRFCLKAF
jgi:hypothetical protein